MSLRPTRWNLDTNACRQCLGHAGPDELKACSRCNSKYHQECHRPYIGTKYLADPGLNWYCSGCTKEARRSDASPICKRSTSDGEACKRQSKRPRVSDADRNIARIAKIVSADTEEAYKPEQRHEQALEGQDTVVKRQDQQPFSLVKGWNTAFSEFNKRMKTINRHFTTNMEELERIQREAGEMTNLGQKMNDATQRITKLEHDVNDRDETILAQERQIKELKAKLTMAKELNEEAARAEQERRRAQEERAMRAHNVFAFDESPLSSCM